MANEFKGADGVSYRWIDADTFTDGTQRYRVDGFNAPETDKIRKEKRDAPWYEGIITDKTEPDDVVRFKAGQQGAKETQNVVENIVQSGGYNIIEDLGKTDTYGRKRVRLKNKFGGDLTNTLYESGAIDATKFTDESGVLAAERGRLLREVGVKKEYDQLVTDQLGAIKEAPVTFKESAANEKEYLNAVISTVAYQQGLDLNKEEDYMKALKIAQSGSYDARSLPFSGIDFRQSDRTKENVAYNQFGTAWNTGWQGMATGLAGFAELLGVGLGSDTIKDWGAEKVWQAKDDLNDIPALKNLDYRNIDNVWDAWGYLTNNVAMSAPYLITLTAGTLAAPITGGLSAGVAYGSIGGSYAGQVWNEIKGPKNKSHAAGSILAGTAMAVLDRLGLAGMGLKPSALLTKEGRLKVANAYRKQNPGVSRREALDTINKESKGVIKETIKGMGNFATDNIQNGKILKRIITGAGRGGLSEGITEMLQEGVGFTSSAAMSEGGLGRNFNPNEFMHLLTASGIAGATLGAGFGTAGQVLDVGDRYAMQRGVMLGTSSRLNEYDKLTKDLGAQGDVNDIIAEAQIATKDDPMKMEQSNLIGASLAGEKQRGSFFNRLKNLPKYLPELYRASVNTAFRPELLRKSAAARKLYALLGQAGGKLYSGVDVEGSQAQVRTELVSLINPITIFKRFGLSDKPSNSMKISNMIRRYMDAKGNMTALRQDTEVMNNLQAIMKTVEDLDNFSNREYFYRNSIWKAQRSDRANKNLDLQNWIDNKTFDWKKVRENRDAWFKFMEGSGYNNKELQTLYDKIANNEDATEFSVVEGTEYVPGTAKNDPSKLSTKPGFDQFANTDIIQNAINNANQTAKYFAYTRYFGGGGKHIDYLLDQMEKEGVSKEEVNEIAYHTKNIIDAGTGNYKRIQNRKIAGLQRQGAFYSAMVGLPLSAISSFPEFVMLFYQNSGMRDIKNGIKSGMNELKNIFKKVGPMEIYKSLRNIPRANVDTQAERRLMKSGQLNDDASVSTRLGMGETDVMMAWWQKQFYKWSAIAGVTQLQRAMAAAAVSGFVSDRIRILSAIPKKPGQGRKIDVNSLTQDQLDIYLQLKNLSIDVDGTIEVFEKYNDTRNKQMFEEFADADTISQNPQVQADYQFIQDQMSNATWYFVNDRIQNPQAFNRPLFFQDPHYQLFVQFNGFISTFTANVVPRLWNDYLRKGTPQMKYNTFALVVTMMAVAGASQWLKDYIKFGGSTPYLSDEQLLQRALQSSGLLGTGERVLQAALPLYRSRDEGIVDRLFGETVGGSPMVRNIITGGKAIGALGQGQTERAVGQATKLIPGIGPITPIRNVINQFIHGKPIDPYPLVKENNNE